MSFVVDIIAMVSGMPRALFPELADTALEGPSEGGVAFALLFAAIPAGAVIGGVLSGWVSRVERHGLAVIVSIVVWGLAVTGFGVAAMLAPLAPKPMLALAVTLLVIGGAGCRASSSWWSQGVRGSPTSPTVPPPRRPARPWRLPGGGVLVVIGTVAVVAVPAFVRYRITLS